MPPVLHESCGPTPVLGVHGFATYAQFFMLKKPDFNLVPGFPDLTFRSGPASRSGPGLKTVVLQSGMLRVGLVSWEWPICARFAYGSGSV